MKENFILKFKNIKNVTKLIMLFFTISFFISCKKEDDTTKITAQKCDEQIIIPTGTAPFSDNFQAYQSFATPAANWTSIVEQGEREFLVITNQGNNFVEMTASNSNKKNKAWLISPKYDFSTIIDKSMSFKLADALQNGNPLKVMYSTNYDGSACPSNNTFIWTEIAASQISNLINNTKNDDFSFEPTGEIDLSGIDKTAVIAFVYQGSANGITTKIQIDDVLIGQSLAFVPVLTSTGTMEQGKTLTANYSPLIDVQGNTVNVTYQWYRADDATGKNETAIAGEKKSTYLLKNTDSGKFITVKTTVKGVETTTDYMGPIVGINTPPVAVIKISGTAEPGKVLTTNTSTSSDIDGDPLTFTYQWYRANNIAGTGETAITNEKKATYTITNADLGKFITVKVIANDGTFNSLEVTAIYILIPFTNNVFFSEIADPNNNTRGRFVELYNAGNTDVDLKGWKIIRYTNGGSKPSTEKHKLVGKIAANSTFVIGKVSDPTTSTKDFKSIYGFAPNQAADPHSDGTVNKVVPPIDSNGDDQILLIAPDGTVMDVFGVIGEDGSGTAHEFEDGKAVRKNTVTKSNPVWNSNEWDIFNDTGAAGTTNAPQNAPGDFTPGVR